MTTSYELSLRLKELGAGQNGEYYWINCLDGRIDCVHCSDSDLAKLYDVICRAFTLGELVREIWVVGIDIEFSNYDTGSVYASCDIALTKKGATPEEAAGELYCEILKQKQQRA